MLLALVVAIVAGSLVVAACDRGGPRRVMLGDTTTEATVRVGDEVVIGLESISASTGYTWEQVAPADPAVLEVVSEHDRGVPGRDLEGDPGRYVLTLRAVGPGSTTVELWQVQAWLDDPVPARELGFRVTVE